MELNKVIEFKNIEKQDDNHTYVFKKDGQGNKNFNAFFIKAVNTDTKSAKGKNISETGVLIGYRNSQGLEKINGSLSAILQEVWGNTESNPQYTRAQHIVKFLNWTLLNRQYYNNYKSLTDLNVEMVVDYLNRASYDYEFETHQYAKTTLLSFYKSLLKHEIIRDHSDINEIFSKVKVPHKYRKVIKHTLPKALISILLEVCEMKCPEILFGVTLGILGGLRCGEIVNLTKTAIRPVGMYDLSANVKDRMLRPDIANPRVRGNVKVPRKQKIYNSYLGIEIFGDKHFKEIYTKHITTFRAIDGNNALFVDSNGQAMTAYNFSKKFNLVKKEFLKQLREHSDPLLYSYAKKLGTDKWGVHILRGIFSNLYAEKVGYAGVKELQMARGDSNPESALRYLMDIDKINEQHEEAVHGMRDTMFVKKPLPLESFKAKKEREE